VFFSFERNINASAIIENLCTLAGLIAAASGQLDHLLQRPCGVFSPTGRCSCFSNGTQNLKVYQNGHVIKPLKGLVNGHYPATGNGAIPI